MTIILDGTKGTTTPGLYSSTTFTGTYTDGIVVDYTTGLGRISVGASDGLAFYNGGVASTELMRLDSSGNLGIGTSSPLTSFFQLTVSGAGGGIAMKGGASDINRLGFTVDGGDGNTGLVRYDHSNNSMQFWTANGTSNGERARIDSSGNLLVGTASNAVTSGGFLLNVGSSSAQYIGHATGTASGVEFVQYRYNNGAIGSVTQNGTTGVLYNLTSDYRLKNNPEPVTGAKDFVMALQPKKWQWWDGSGEGVGFIAHEFMEVAKYSGHGEKDAVDADGNPVYQSIQPSSSEVMANLVAFIQEQQAIIQQLQADVAALKGQA